MQSILTSHSFPLSSVKPLEELLRYREYCLDASRKALLKNSRKREYSPIGEGPLEPFGNIGGLEYVRCKKTGSFFLAHLPTAETWARLLSDVTEYRHSLQAFRSDITKSRLENVFEPALFPTISATEQRDIEKKLGKKPSGKYVRSAVLKI